MSKSVKNANWGCGGALCVLISIGILAVYFVTGGLPAKGGRILKGENAGVCAFGMNAFFFLMGILSIGISFLQKRRRNAERKDFSSWRERG